MIEEIPLTIQYKSEEIDVNKKSTPASMISFRATNMQATSTFTADYGYRQGR